MLQRGRSNLYRGRSLKIRSSNTRPGETKNGAGRAGLGDSHHILPPTEPAEGEPTQGTMKHEPVPENLQSGGIPRPGDSANAGATLAWQLGTGGRGGEGHGGPGALQRRACLFQGKHLFWIFWSSGFKYSSLVLPERHMCWGGLATGVQEIESPEPWDPTEFIPAVPF